MCCVYGIEIHVMMSVLRAILFSPSLSLSVNALTTRGNTCFIDWVEQGGAVRTEATLHGDVGGFIASVELIVVSVGTNAWLLRVQ